MRRAEVSPAALGSIGLHAAIAAALMISWGSRDLKVGSVVPVTIVSNAPAAEPSPAIEAPATETALTETPVPDAPVESAPPPEPQPAPAPAPPTPAPKPAAKAPAPKAAPAKKQPEPDFFESLAASVKSARPSNPRPSSAAKGPSRAETAPTPRNTGGLSAASGAALQGLAEELQRRWNPNCDVQGGRDVLVRVGFMIGVGGSVTGDVKAEIQGARTPAAQAAADRAVRAVYAASPFRTLPRELYGERVTVNFNAREACASR